MKRIVNNSIQAIIITIKDSEIAPSRKAILIESLNNINFTSIIAPSITAIKIKQILPTLTRCNFNDAADELKLLSELLEDRYTDLKSIQIDAIGIVLSEVEQTDTPDKKINSIAELCNYCPEAEVLINNYVNEVTDTRISAISKDIESLCNKLKVIADRSNN